MFPPQFQNLVEQISQLPGIGPKTAERLAFFLLNNSREKNQKLASAIVKIKESVRYCPKCFNFSEATSDRKEARECKICRDKKRDKNILCLVETPLDILTLEKTQVFKGYYFVLGGLLNPLQGIGPQDLHFKELCQRLKREKIKELLLAFNQSAEGDQTVLYIRDLLKNYPLKITRLAQGIPRGGEIGYMDKMTLQSAIKERKEV